MWSPPRPTDPRILATDPTSLSFVMKVSRHIENTNMFAGFGNTTNTQMFNPNQGTVINNIPQKTQNIQQNPNQNYGNLFGPSNTNPTTNIQTGYMPIGDPNDKMGVWGNVVESTMIPNPFNQKK